MKDWAVIASGESVSVALVERVRHLTCVAVSDGFRLAPWARALVATDANWWRKTPGAFNFAGERWCASAIEGCRQMPPRGSLIGTFTNSGLLGLDYAVQHGAKRIFLLGVDMVGSHFFGEHKAMKNTTPERFAIFRTQFAAYANQLPPDVAVVNCSPISALECFQKRALDDVIEEREAA